MVKVIWRDLEFIYIQLFFIAVLLFITFIGNYNPYNTLLFIIIAATIVYTFSTWRFAIGLHIRDDGIQIAGYEGKFSKGKLQLNDRSLLALDKLFSRKFLRWNEIQRIRLKHLSGFAIAPFGTSFLQIETKDDRVFVQEVLRQGPFLRAISEAGQQKKLIFED